MPRFPLHDLSDSEFEKLVVYICRELMGIGITSFAPGRDGGKDAKFEGTARAFPSAAAPASGKFIIQAKHTTSPVASCSDSEFETTLIDREIPKIRRMAKDGTLTHYLIFTNRRKTGGAEDRIPDRIKAATGIEHVWLRGLEDIERELSYHPGIVTALGLDKFRLPIQFVPEDLRDVILALHAHRQSLSIAFDSEHDFRDYPGLPAKNTVNGLTPRYDAYIKDDSMPHFRDVEGFLKNPRNEGLKEQYHTVANELKGQLLIHRDHFSTFDEALEALYILILERSPEVRAVRRLVKILIHYMYVNCEIGQKQ
ncbi:MAG: ABC-three component system protein [Verrucomicrobiales bacterium]